MMSIALPVWEIHNHARAFEPVDEVVQRLIAKYGPTNEVNEYLAKVNGHWMAVPSNSGSQNQPPVGRISVLRDKAGLDLLSMYPVNDQYTPGADAWTWEAHLKAAEACTRPACRSHSACPTLATASISAGHCSLPMALTWSMRRAMSQCTQTRYARCWNMASSWSSSCQRTC